MNLADFRLLTDENIDPQTVAFLRSVGFDVIDVCEQGWQGRVDGFLLATATQEQRIVVTHDADFGRLAIMEAKPLTGILYLRPGHIDPEFTIDTIKMVLASRVELSPPFIVVAKRTGERVSLRVRSLFQ